MFSKYDVIKAFKKQNPDAVGYKLSDDEKDIVSLKTGAIVFSVDEYVDFLRKKYHCDFECIYHEHGSLTTIYRCRECGTVIFGGDDERYDPNLCCPDCGNYKTSLEFWTQTEIDADENKQKAINAYHEFMREMHEQNLRYQKRGLQDWEIWKKDFKTKSGRLEFSLECNNLFRTGLKGLRFEITKWKCDGDGFYKWEKEYYIPLSPFAFRIWIHKRNRRKEIKEKQKTTV